MTERFISSGSKSPIVRVRRFLDKMKTERGDFKNGGNAGSPQILRLKRSPPSRTTSSELTPRLHQKKKQENCLSGSSFKSSVYVEPYFGENQFNNLPIESILSILSFLDSKDLLIARLVSKEWSQISDDDLVWKNLCIHDWDIYHPLQESSWKSTYFKLEDLYSDGIWEGMSKWVDPPSYDNEQVTTAKLAFSKRIFSSPKIRKSNSSKDEISTISDDDQVSSTSTLAPISASTSSSSATTASFARITASTSSKEEIDEKSESSEFQINGSGVTINCASPSPFSIKGHRTKSDADGFSFTWNKNFEKHTSIYLGTLNYEDRSVQGTIDYNDGSIHWKGIFFYTKLKNNQLSKKNKHKYHVNA